MLELFGEIAKPRFHILDVFYCADNVKLITIQFVILLMFFKFVFSNLVGHFGGICTVCHVA